MNEEHILRAPTITMPDHGAMSNARCGRPQRLDKSG